MMDTLTRNQKILLVVVLSSTICVLANILALFYSMPHVPKNIITDVICLPDGTSELRCGKTAKRLLEYTRTQIDAELETLMSEYKGYGRQESGHPVARLVMNDIHNDKDDEKIKSNMVPITTWEKGKELPFHGGFLRFGMLNNDGRIMVYVNGTYSISSYILMSPKPGSEGMHLRHALYKYNLKENKETKLVSNLKPLKNRKEQGSFLTTLAKLSSGEQILVKVSDNADLPKHEQNYLAVYLI